MLRDRENRSPSSFLGHPILTKTTHRCGDRSKAGIAAAALDAFVNELNQALRRGLQMGRICSLISSLSPVTVEPFLVGPFRMQDKTSRLRSQT
jgi:hypothetical protein